MLAPGSTSISLMVSGKMRGRGSCAWVRTRPSFSSRARSAKFTTALPSSVAAVPGTTPGVGGADRTEDLSSLSRSSGPALERAGVSTKATASRNALHAERAGARQGRSRKDMETSGGTDQRGSRKRSPAGAAPAT